APSRAGAPITRPKRDHSHGHRTSALRLDRPELLPGARVRGGRAYTRRYDREKRMEQVRSLSWQRLTDRRPQIAESQLGESLGVGAGGFEPPKAEPTGLQPVPFGRSGTPPRAGGL